MLRRILWILLALPLTAGALLASARTIDADDEDVVARALDSVLTWRELDAVLLSRHAMSKDGRAALRHLAESRVLETAGREQGIDVPDRIVEARWKDLDQQILASGDKQGIAGYLK